eukprot:CAMPEP_0182417692 /NCGR_PEP_ID=MMETSP1167-20130531/2125_1 /TAXON_ID=2988 /ORGANISM="Mallomonas Sp, Strain CCMP3275" /LENGTH=285 /DNA_ID=CAMNT_0024591409 /DNA_START=408 /DNA_END=1265 /DNA_ORIENTATION=+
MSEVHIEESNAIAVAPFNGSYPEHAQHLKTANLDINHNLWYDVFDHNDPEKSRKNWTLLPENNYEDAWFPAGPCDIAIPRTAVGSVMRETPEQSETMQSFGFHQLVDDSKALAAAAAAATGPPAVLSQLSTPPAPPAEASVPSVSSSPVKKDSDEFQITNIINSFIHYVPGANSSWAAEGLVVMQGDGTAKPLVDPSVNSGSLAIDELWNLGKISVAASGDMAYASFWARHLTITGNESTNSNFEGVLVYYTIICSKSDSGEWKLVHVQRSVDCVPSQMGVPKTH